MSKSNLGSKKPICSRPSKQKVTPNASCAANPKTPHLDLDLVNKITDRVCNCEVVARAVRDDVARYLGMSDRRAALVEAMANSNTNLNQPETSEDKDDAIFNGSQNKLASQSKVVSQSKVQSQGKVVSQSKVQSQSKVDVIPKT